MEFLRHCPNKKVQMPAILLACLAIAGCQSAPKQEETVETVETTVYIERDASGFDSNDDSNVVVVKEQKKVTPAQPPKTLSVLQVTTGQGCPSRDPNTYGVFLKSEKVEDGLLCYYD